jgi:hypothetical protein
MSTSPPDQFRNVPMPRWYRIGAVAGRVLGFVAMVATAWLFLHSSSGGSRWHALAFFAGLALLILPSFPKACLEQRNRLRGLGDGSFQQNLDEQSTKR